MATCRCGTVISGRKPCGTCNAPYLEDGTIDASSLLLRREVREALRVRNWQFVLEAVKVELDLSDGDIARAAEIPQTTVSRQRNGGREIKERTVARLCAGLNIPTELAGVGADADPEHVEDDTNRRDFLAMSVGGVAQLAFGTRPFRAISRRDSQARLAKLEAQAPRLRQLNNRHGGAEKLRRAARDLATEADSLVQHGSLDDTRADRAKVLTAELTMYVGWLEYDAGNLGATRHFFQQAQTQAIVTGDRLNEVYALESLAVQSTFAFRAKEGLGLAQLAQQRAAGWASPRLRSLLRMREACAHAVLGNPTAFETALRNAWSDYDDRPHTDDPPWLDFYVPAEVQGLEALSLLSLEQPERASVEFVNVLGGLSDDLQRNRLYYSSLLGKTYASLRNDSDLVATLTPDVLRSAAASGSTRTHNHIGDVISMIEARGQNTRHGREFLEVARAVKFPKRMSA